MKKGLFNISKKKKLTNWETTAQHEKIFIAALVAVIFLLIVYIGYDIFQSFHTKDETSFLNSAVVSLNQEKSELLSQINNLNQTAIVLTDKVLELTEEKSNLTSQVSTLQTNYNSCIANLDDCEDDLDDCESSCP